MSLSQSIALVSWRTAIRRRLAIAVAAAVSVAGCSPAVVLNAFVPDDGYRTIEALPYGALERQKLDLYVPEGEASEPRPIITFFYGGSWKSGERSMYRFVGEALTRLGYVVAVPDYRLYPDVTFPAFVEDAALALAWLRTNGASYGGDPDRIVVMGHSAGAHIAMLVLADRHYLEDAGVERSAIRAGVGMAGPYAINPLKYDSIRPIFAGAGRSGVYQPLTFVDGEEPPLLLMHGADDNTVEVVNSERLADRVRSAGGLAQLRTYEDLGHIGLVLSLSSLFRGRDAVYDDIAAFLATTLASKPDTADRGRQVAE